MKRGIVSHPVRFYNLGEDCVVRPAAEKGGGSKTAILFFDERGASGRWSRAELAQACRGLAVGLKKSGIKKGQRILVKLPNGPEFPAAFFGTVLAGAIPIPVSPLLTSSEIRFLKKDSGAVRVLDVPARIRRWMRTPIDAQSAGTARMRTRPDEPAFWLYTSGTEGRPKGVIHAHRSIPAHDDRCRLWMDLKPGDIVFNTSSLNWSYGLTCGLSDTLRHGAVPLIYSGKPDPEALLRVIEEGGVDLFLSVPGIYRRLVEFLEKRPSQRKRVQKVRVWISAGEKLPREIRTRFQRMTRKFIREGLGMTEHSVFLVQPKGSPVVEGSCGRSLVGNRIAILREDLGRARPFEVGILASRRSCKGLMLGYYKRPAEMKKSFRKGWFLSGDFAYRDAKGNFFYVGRRDDVITAGGYRISPMEVENVLNRHPAISESAAVGVEVSAGKTIVSAFVVLEKRRRPTKLLRRSILEFAAERLARYKAPRKIEFVGALPKTSNGKLIRKKFRSA